MAKLLPSDYVHLHNHTHYSVLDGLTKVPALIDFVKSSGMQAIAKTDHGTLSGAIEFYKTAKAAEIKPIIGMETYIAARTYQDKEAGKDKPNFHLILLAQNNTGYQNLMQLSSIANLEGFYYKPRIDHELLEKYNEGLIVLSGCMGSEIGEALQRSDYESAKQIATWYKSIFKDRYYLEIQDSGHPDHPSNSPEQQKINEFILRLGEELDIPCVVTCDAHYLRHTDQDAHEILLCVQTSSFLSETKRMSLKEWELHVTEPKDIIKRWGKDHAEVVTNTKQIADRCDVDIQLGKILIPKFPVPKGEDEKSYLHALVWRGLVQRYGQVTGQKLEKFDAQTSRKLLPKNIIERAEYELGVIDNMGYNGYFLIVSDFINWGKDQGIIFGPGRGSAAGSIVSYALRITEIDPMKYELMFERFLNPGRISMPDIDVDIQDTRRDEVIQYCVKKYGSARVTNIVTFGKMAARNAIRDVARVLEVPYSEADRLSKMVPPPVQGRHIPLVKSLKDDADLKQEYKSNPTSKRILDLAVQLDGTIRSHGIHAAGVVIAPDDVVKFAPLEMAQKGVISTQYPMGPVEELGLLKMDFLGLSNLTIINNALRIIKKVYKNDISLLDIPNDDIETMALFRRADTTGVFQFESTGMKRYLKRLQPTEFMDIVAMNALYRPGPMEQIPAFIKGKNNPESISYLHDSLKPVLQDTYGVIVYQENIIQLLQLVAGYTPGEADLVRKAIGKKNRGIMAAEEPKFIEGCQKKGISKKNAEKLWALIQPFADYSFNKAHATCYSQIAYWTAYLKAHYPDAYMAALMTNDQDNTDRLAIDITECKHMGLAVLPPDVNESFDDFAIVPDAKQIRFGLDAVKNVGSNAVAEILRARNDGPFVSLEDFFTRVDIHIANRKTIESLLKSGAFDRYGERSLLIHNLDVLLGFASRIQKDRSKGQTDLFGEIAEEHGVKPLLALDNEAPEISQHEQLAWERELLGLYLSHHPLESFSDFLMEQAIPIKDLRPEHDNKSVVIGGLVSDIREITTKKGQKMAFIKIEDMDGELEIILFPKSYQATAGSWVRDRVVLVTGKISAKDKAGNLTDELKLLVDEVGEVTPEQAANYQSTGKKPKAPSVSTSVYKKSPQVASQSSVLPPKLYIRLASTEDQTKLLELKQTIDNHLGGTDVVLVLGAGAKRQAIKLPGGVDSSNGIVDELSKLVGLENVKLQ